VKLIGVEELALGLVRIGIVSSNELWSESTDRSSRDGEVHAGVVISQGKGSSEPSPLKSPSSIGKVSRNSDSLLARLEATISGTIVSSVRI